MNQQHKDPNLNPEQQQQNLDSVQTQYLEKLANVTEEQFYQAAMQTLNDSVDAYTALGINRALVRVQADYQSALQQRINSQHQELSERVVHHRSQLPQADAIEPPQLETPSLQEGINQAQQQFGYISYQSKGDLPSDLSDALDA